MVLELEYDIEIVKSSNKFIAIINSSKKPVTERDAKTIEKLLEQMARELQEDNEE